MKRYSVPVTLGVTIWLAVAGTTVSAQQAQQMLAERERLDQTLWQAEELAQHYEQRFVRLWDELLRSDAKYQILKQFPLETLALGDADADSVESMDLGIARTRFGQPHRELATAEWQALLERFERDGYAIEQTEWHHSRFEPPEGDRAARSEVSATIHAARAQPAHRVILRATLDVTWSPRVDAQDVPIPERIALSKLDLLERHAPAAFEKVFEVERLGTRFPILPLLVYDLDGDGLSEIILGGRNLALWNRGGGQFEAEAFLEDGTDRIFADAAILADFTNDGHVDFVGVDLERYPLLFEGNADGKFTETGRRIADVTFEQPKSFTAGDADGDGDLDLFIANYKNAYEGGQMPTPYYDANDGYPAALLRNDGNGTFTDVTEAAGLAAKRNRRTYSSSFVDLDDDGDQDLLVVSDFAGFDMYLNDGRGRFTDVADRFGEDRHLFGMAHTFGDYDQDGALDFYVIGMSSTTARRLESLGIGPEDKPEHNALRAAMGYGNRMFLRRGDGYELAEFNDDVARSGWSWGTSSFDFDNDGDRDIFVANGHLSGGSTADYCTTFWRHDIYTDDSQDDAARETMFQFVMSPLQDTEISWNGYEHKVLWMKMNDGDTEFTNVAYLFGVAFEYDGRAVVTEDLDADGIGDLLVVEYKSGGGSGDDDDHRLHVYQNRLAEAGNWIGVRLPDAADGFWALGATITLESAAGTQVQRLVSGDSYSAQHSATAHFGLGDAGAVDAIEVRWANGTTRRIEHPEINQYLMVTPPGR
ncbi:MAG: CRTAC1 family protein [Vicinamibacterales bacterium]|nr:CRTAC1 family protein [Vicinamibacterales bacterium]